MTVDEVVQHLLLFCLDAVPCRLYLPDSAGVHHVIPFAEPFPCLLPCWLLVPEYGSHHTNQRISLFELGIEFEEQAGPLFLVLSPLVTGFWQDIPGSCEQFDQRVAVVQLCRPPFLPPQTLPATFPAFGLLPALRLLLIPFPGISPPLGFLLLVLLPCGLLLLRLGDGEPLEAQAHLVEGLAKALHDMEAVDDDGGVGEARLDNGVHRVAEVHRHFLHLPALGQGYHHQDPRYDIGLGALDHGDQRPLPATAVLVGEYRVDIVAYRRLVY